MSLLLNAHHMPHDEIYIWHPIIKFKTLGWRPMEGYPKEMLLSITV